MQYFTSLGNPITSNAYFEQCLLPVSPRRNSLLVNLYWKNFILLHCSFLSFSHGNEKNFTVSSNFLFFFPSESPYAFLPVYGSGSFCSRSADLSRCIFLDTPVSLFALKPQLPEESMNSPWFSVCPVSSCKDRSDDFQALYMLSHKSAHAF